MTKINLESIDIKDYFRDMQSKLLAYEEHGFKIKFDDNKLIKGIGYKVDPTTATVIVHGVNGNWGSFKQIKY